MFFKVLVLITGLSAATVGYFFRKDYDYIQARGAFYKGVFSEAGKSFETAFMSCYDEGSILFYPTDNYEWKVINNLVQRLPKTPNTTEVLLGLRDEVGNGNYLAVDGHIVTLSIEQQDDHMPLDCVVMDLNTGALKATFCKVDTNPRLFVCKKMDDSPCPTMDKGYIYNKDLKKCYKVNQRRKSWNNALETCYMEGGLLAVVESEAEANALYEMLPQSSDRNQKFHSGFRKISEEFYTLKGKRQEDSYSKWFGIAPVGQPRNYEVDEELRPDHIILSSDCGILLLTNGQYYYNGYREERGLYISSIMCDDINPFVCEIQARF